MFKPTMLSLPLLLAGASCVPPDARIASAGSRDLAYVDLNEMDAGRGSYERILSEDARGPLPSKLPRIDPVAIAPGAPARPFDIGGQKQDDAGRSLDCLTTAIYHEARSEAEEGQRAVAQVVLNRVRHRAFPNSVCGVVYQGSQRRTGCQFSFTCDGSLRRRVEPSAWDRARTVAVEALSGSVYEPVGVATHYHTTAVRPWWAASLTRAVTVGSHIFYRWRGSWGHPLAFRERYAGAEPGAAPAAAFGQDGAPAEAAQGTPVRVAALIDGVRINIHRSRAGASEAAQSGVPGVRIHRGGTGSTAAASPAVAVHVGEPPILASAAPADEVAATE